MLEWVIDDAYSTERDAQLSLKWSGVNSKQLLYSEKTITIWKAYNVGKGKKVPSVQNKWGKVFHLFNIFHLKCGVQGSMLPSRSA